MKPKNATQVDHETFYGAINKIGEQAKCSTPYPLTAVYTVNGETVGVVENKLYGQALAPEYYIDKRYL